MKRRILFITAITILLALTAVTAAVVSAEDAARTASSGAESAREENAIPDDTPVTYGYFKAFREQIKREIIEELRSEGGLSEYRDITLARGDVIVPAPGCELIFRGGCAVAVTSSDKALSRENSSTKYMKHSPTAQVLPSPPQLEMMLISSLHMTCPTVSFRSHM